VAYRTSRRLCREDANVIAKSRFLAFAENTWKRHASNIRSVVRFLSDKGLGLFECNAQTLCLFLLAEVTKGKTVSVIEAAVDAYGFVTKFFDMADCSKQRAVRDVLKYVEKVAVKNSNKKNAFGEAEVIKCYDSLVKKFGLLQNWSKLQLRTFVMAVFQFKTFCRFSDVEKIKLKDVHYDIEFFKFLISTSKTDQRGDGEFVYLTNSVNDPLDVFSIFCTYLHVMEFDNVESENVFLFPPLNAQQEIVPGKSISYNVALRNFKIMLQNADLDAKLFGLHSPRVGAATEAFFNNVPYHVIDQQGRWKSVNSKFNYLRLNEKHLIKRLT
jgi:hypothetical protein